MARQQDVRVCLVLVPSHPPAQLIQIAQPKSVRPIDDDRVRIRDIESALNNCRAHQHVDVALDESPHDIFQFVIAHLTVPDVDADLRSFQQRPQPRGHRFNALHAVVQEIHLPATVEFALDGLLDQPLVVARNNGLDGQPILRRRLDIAHVARASQ